MFDSSGQRMSFPGPLAIQIKYLDSLALASYGRGLITSSPVARVCFAETALAYMRFTLSIGSLLTGLRMLPVQFQRRKVKMWPWPAVS
jgi:hypothetical protein